MPKRNLLIKSPKVSLLIPAFLSFLCLSTYAQTPDPVVDYLVDGKFVSNWVGSVGNGLNWFVPVKDQQAQTERKNLVVKPATKVNEGDAINVKWKGKKLKNEWGGNVLYDSSLNISKHQIDISSVQDVAAIVLDLKLLRAPSEAVTLSMQCNNSNKCIGKYAFKSLLKRIEKNKWISLPIPLNCFKSESDFDFSKITNVLSIATQGKLELEIANIGLAALPEGDKGCNT